MFKWLRAKEVLDAQYVEAGMVVAQPEKVVGPIGEPVKSLIEAMADVHQWSVNVNSSYSSNSFYLTHIEHELKIGFYVDRDYTYGKGWVESSQVLSGLEWATAAEKEALVQAFLQFKIAYEVVQDEYTAMLMQVEREKFMVFVK